MLLTVNAVINQRIRKGDKTCSICLEDVDATEYISYFCKKAKEIWRFVPFQWKV